MAVVEDRKANPSEKSYTTRLLSGGVDKTTAKFSEEAGELVEAAREPGDAGRDHTIHEAADVVYHLLVLLASKDVALSDVETVLEGRFGIGGLEEKASRTQEPPKGDTENKPASDFPS
ncbi:MAG: phosphoribosyl-ATP diphosphatase [Planctomycetota bacterium]|nr:MAG: phosphoribosyl-ATP diphosphatase [Planctomycetota bacterium]